MLAPCQKHNGCFQAYPQLGIAVCGVCLHVRRRGHHGVDHGAVDKGNGRGGNGGVGQRGRDNQVNIDNS